MKDIYPRAKTVAVSDGHDWVLITSMAVILAALITGLVVWILTSAVAEKQANEQAEEIQTLQEQVTELQK